MICLLVIIGIGSLIVVILSGRNILCMKLIDILGICLYKNFLMDLMWRIVLENWVDLLVFLMFKLKWFMVLFKE